VAGYIRVDKKRNIEPNIFSLEEKILEYQHNYSEYILGMPMYQIPQKLYDYHT
jgi:hypothetical protein